MISDHYSKLVVIVAVVVVVVVVMVVLDIREYAYSPIFWFEPLI